MAYMGFHYSASSLLLQVPFGMKNGAPISVGTYIWRNMIPVAIGNTIAGARATLSPYPVLPYRIGDPILPYAGPLIATASICPHHLGPRCID